MSDTNKSSYSAELTFELEFAYPRTTYGTGNIWLKLPEESMYFGTFEQIPTEDGQPIFRYRARFYRDVKMLEAQVQDELPGFIMEALKRQHNASKSEGNEE